MPYVNHFLSLPADLHAELRSLAAQRGIAFSDLIIESLLQHAEALRSQGWAADDAPFFLNESCQGNRYAS